MNCEGQTPFQVLRQGLLCCVVDSSVRYLHRRIWNPRQSYANVKWKRTSNCKSRYTKIQWIRPSCLHFSRFVRVKRRRRKNKFWTLHKDLKIICASLLQRFAVSTCEQLPEISDTQSVRRHHRQSAKSANNIFNRSWWSATNCDLPSLPIARRSQKRLSEKVCSLHQLSANYHLFHCSRG